MDTEMNPDLLVKAADYASHQSDRWLLVAFLIIGILCVGWLVRYFVTTINKIQERADQQTKEANARVEKVTGEFTDTLKTTVREQGIVIIEHTKVSAKHAEALEANTAVIKRLLDKDRV